MRSRVQLNAGPHDFWTAKGNRPADRRMFSPFAERDTLGSCAKEDRRCAKGAMGESEASGYLYDLNLNAESYYALNDREVMNISYVYGAKLSADGTLLFQPTTKGIDVLDGRLGNLLHRIALPVSLSSNYDALVADGKDNVLITITGVNGDGVAVVDLTSIKEPSPLPYAVRPGPESSRDMNQRSLLPEYITQSRLNGRTNTLPSIGRRVPHVTKPISLVPENTARRPAASKVAE